MSPSIHSIVHKAEIICLFGVGKLFAECYEQICSVLGKPPDYLTDNNPSMWGESFFGVECLSPEQLSTLDKSILIVISVRQYEAIYQQLIDLGFTNIVLLDFGRAYNIVRGLREIKTLPQTNVSLYPLNVAGKWALVTGASRGIGYQIALALASLGVNLLLHSRSHKHNKDIVEACSAMGVEAISISADLADLGELDSMSAELKNVDILINCAGVSIPNSTAWNVNSDDFLYTLKINTVAPVQLCNAVIPYMIKRGFGRIVNVSSTIQGRACEAVYASSKAALDKYVHDISSALEDSGVKISLLDPGWLKTDMGGEAATHEVSTVLPGALLGIVMKEFKNGTWFSAQDYAGYTLDAAVEKATWLIKIA